MKAHFINGSNGGKKNEIGEYMGYIPEEGFVPDEKTAVKIAEAVLLPIYGEAICDESPFIAEFDEVDNCWFVHGTLPRNTLGGVAMIKIHKIDGKILFVSHGK